MAGMIIGCDDDLDEQRKTKLENEDEDDDVKSINDDEEYKKIKLEIHEIDKRITATNQQIKDLPQIKTQEEQKLQQLKTDLEAAQQNVQNKKEIIDAIEKDKKKVEAMAGTISNFKDCKDFLDFYNKSDSDKKKSIFFLEIRAVYENANNLCEILFDDTGKYLTTSLDLFTNPELCIRYLQDSINNGTNPSMPDYEKNPLQAFINDSDNIELIKGVVTNINKFTSKFATEIKIEDITELFKLDLASHIMLSKIEKSLDWEEEYIGNLCDKIKEATSYDTSDSLDIKVKKFLQAATTVAEKEKTNTDDKLKIEKAELKKTEKTLQEVEKAFHEQQMEVLKLDQLNKNLDNLKQQKSAKEAELKKREEAFRAEQKIKEENKNRTFQPAASNKKSEQKAKDDIVEEKSEIEKQNESKQSQLQDKRRTTDFEQFDGIRNKKPEGIGPLKRADGIDPAAEGITPQKRTEKIGSRSESHAEAISM